jgi:hypothetical protein
VWERTVKDQFDVPPHYAGIMSMSTWKSLQVNCDRVLPRMRRRRCKSHLALSRSPAIRNVWSAAVLQAKSEDGRIGLRECIRPLLE